MADLGANNGVVHVIDTVVLPKALESMGAGLSSGETR
jgi:hypothetical protein